MEHSPDRTIEVGTVDEVITARLAVHGVILGVTVDASQLDVAVTDLELINRRAWVLANVSAVLGAVRSRLEQLLEADAQRIVGRRPKVSVSVVDADAFGEAALAAIPQPTYGDRLDAEARARAAAMDATPSMAAGGQIRAELIGARK